MNFIEQLHSIKDSKILSSIHATIEKQIKVNKARTTIQSTKSTHSTRKSRQCKKTEKPAKIIDFNKICVGRTSNGDRCSRSKQTDSEFCKCHQRNSCFGTVNQKPTRAYYDQIIKKKKCEYIEHVDTETLSKLDLESNYTKLYFVMIEGKEYLIDDDNKLYTFDKIGKSKLNKVGFVDDEGDINLCKTE